MLANLVRRIVLVSVLLGLLPVPAHALQQSGPVEPAAAPPSIPAQQEPGDKQKLGMEQSAAIADAGYTSIAPILYYQGHAYTVSYRSDKGYHDKSPSFFWELTNDFLATHGISHMVVTEDGIIVTDKEKIRKVFELYLAAAWLYNMPFTREAESESDSWYKAQAYALSLLSTNKLVPSLLTDQRDVYRDTFAQLLTDSTAIGADTQQRVLGVETPRQLGDTSSLMAVFGAALDSTLALHREMGRAVDAADVAVKVYSNSLQSAGTKARLAGDVAKVLAGTFFAQEVSRTRLGWLQTYVQATKDGPGKFNDVQASAASDAMRETEKGLAAQTQTALILLRQIGFEELSSEIPNLAAKLASAGLSKWGLSTLAKGAGALGIAVTANALWYNTDEFFADYLQSEKAIELNRLFYAKRTALELEAKEAQTNGVVPDTYEGELAEQYRSAYLLEVAASSMARRLYAEGYEALYRVPNLATLVEKLRGGVNRDAARELAASAAAEEVEAYNLLSTDRFIGQALKIIDETVPEFMPPPVTQEVRFTPADYTEVIGVSLSPDGRWLAVSAGSEGVQIYDTGRWSEKWEVAEIIKMDLKAFDAAFSPDGKMLAACGLNGELRMFAVGSWTLESTISETLNRDTTGTEGAGCTLAFTPDGRYLIYSIGVTHYAFDMIKEKVVASGDFALTLYSGPISMSPLGDRFVQADGMGNLVVYGIPDLEVVGNVVGFDAGQIATTYLFVKNYNQAAEAAGVQTSTAIAVDYDSGEIALFNGDTLSPIGTMPGTHLAAAPRAPLLAVFLPETNEIVVRDMIAERDIAVHETDLLDNRSRNFVLFDDPGQRLIAVNFRQGRASIWAIDAGASVAPSNSSPGTKDVSNTASAATASILDSAAAQPPSVEGAVPGSESAAGKRLVVKVENLNMRRGPGKNETVLVQVDTGQILTVLARNSDTSWLYVCCSGNIAGWVINDEEYVKIENDSSLDTLPISLAKGGPYADAAKLTAAADAGYPDVNPECGLRQLHTAVTSTGINLSETGLQPYRSTDTSYKVTTEAVLKSINCDYVPESVTCYAPTDGTEERACVAQINAGVWVLIDYQLTGILEDLAAYQWVPDTDIERVQNAFDAALQRKELVEVE